MIMLREAQAGLCRPTEAPGGKERLPMEIDDQMSWAYNS